MNDRQRHVLSLIKSVHFISAVEIGKRLAISEKQARTAIDGVRVFGEFIWNDPNRKVFWWRNDRPIGTGAGKWKRVYVEP